MNRTHYAGSLRIEDVNKEVVLCGWVHKKRNLGSLVFIDIRDREGIAQLLFDENTDKEINDMLASIGREYVIEVRGKVQERSQKNTSIPTGEVEVKVDELKILSTSEVPPIHIEEDDNAADSLKLKYRYLDLRKKSMTDTLRLRSRLNSILRNELLEKGFVEVETPILNKSTPEGARDYLVPSRVNQGEFYALPQSPQIFKQLLMISGLDRYFQIAKCFRDEDLRADRQPEFTQLDIEMSFVSQEDVLSLGESLMVKVFRELKGIELKRPFKKLKYSDAIRIYGSDKPDDRFALELLELNDVFKNSEFTLFSSAIERGEHVGAIFLEGRELFSKKGLKNLEKKAKVFGAKGLATFIIDDQEIDGSIAKFLNIEEIDKLREIAQNKNGYFFFIVDNYRKAKNILGNLRNHFGKELNMYDPQEISFIWIVDFPAFMYDEEEGRWVSEHHPFTQLKEEDIPKMKTNPSEVLANCYDLVLNGYELVSGSIRIHDSKLQAEVFNFLGISEEEQQQRFGFFIEALKYGTPPHGGLAFGLDRLMMILKGTDVIKDVVAFPKTLNARCLMSSAPSTVDKSQLDELNIMLKEEK